jgi:hypothetical protein
MGTWSTTNADIDHAEYSVVASLDGVTTCGFRVVLTSNDGSGTFVEADAETVLDAVLSTLGTNADITVLFKTRVYPTQQSYTP